VPNLAVTGEIALQIGIIFVALALLMLSFATPVGGAKRSNFAAERRQISSKW